MAVSKNTVSKDTIFGLAQKQMFDTVKSKVRKDLVDEWVGEFEAHINALLDDYLAEYSTLEVMSLWELSTFSEQFVIYVQNDHDKVQTGEGPRR